MITIKNTDEFKKSIEQVALFVDECNLRINEDGLYIRAFDRAQMLYLTYHLNSLGLLGELESNIVGLNVSEFNKIISKISSSEKISINFDSSSIELIIEGNYKRVYTMPIRDIDEKEFTLNKDNYLVNLNNNANLIKDIFSSAKLISDAILFDVNTQFIEIYSDGIYGKYKTQIDCKSSESFKIKFYLSHLNNMVKNLDSDSLLSIRIGKDMPIYLSYKIGNNELEYFLANMFI